MKKKIDLILMKKKIILILVLDLLMALNAFGVLTACGAGAAETSVSASSDSDTSVSAEVEENDTHEYTAADLDGIVKLDGFGVVQGSADIDLVAAIEYDSSIVAGITVDAADVTYELASAQLVTYTITVNKAALDDKLGIITEAGDGEDETVVIEVMRRVPVVAPANTERFLGLNPDMVLLTDGNIAYSPVVNQDSESGDNTEINEGEGKTVPDAPSGDGEQPAATDGETPASGDGDSSDSNSNQAGTSNGGTGSQNNDTTTQPETPSGSGSGSGGGSGSGSQNNGTTSQPSNPSGGSGSNAEPVHTHTWVEQTDKKWVVDQAAWDEPIYESKEVCSACGAAFSPGTDTDLHILDVHGGAASYSVRQFQVGTTHHDEVGHYETVVTGYKCSECGATK